MKPIMSEKAFNQINNIMTFAAAIIVAVAFWGMAGIYTVPSSSMYPTIEIGSLLFSEPVASKDLKYGDIVLFFPEADESIAVRTPYHALYFSKFNQMRVFTKRVVGFEGDVIEVKDGHLWRNGEMLVEEYVYDDTGGEYGPYVVPEGHIFCMGDNRNNSVDSRYYDAFPENAFFGRVRFVLPNLFPSETQQ